MYILKGVSIYIAVYMLFIYILWQRSTRDHHGKIPLRPLRTSSRGILHWYGGMHRRVITCRTHQSLGIPGKSK